MKNDECWTSNDEFFPLENHQEAGWVTSYKSQVTGDNWQVAVELRVHSSEFNVHSWNRNGEQLESEKRRLARIMHEEVKIKNGMTSNMPWLWYNQGILWPKRRSSHVLFFYPSCIIRARIIIEPFSSEIKFLRMLSLKREMLIFWTFIFRHDSHDWFQLGGTMMGLGWHVPLFHWR